MTTTKFPSIVLPEETGEALRERLTVADFLRVMSRPFRREMLPRLYRDACILSRAGFEEWECELIIRARCAGFLRSIPDKEFINAVRNASERCLPGPMSPTKATTLTPIRKSEIA